MAWLSRILVRSHCLDSLEVRSSTRPADVTSQVATERDSTRFFAVPGADPGLSLRSPGAAPMGLPVGSYNRAVAGAAGLTRGGVSSSGALNGMWTQDLRATR